MAVSQSRSFHEEREAIVLNHLNENGRLTSAEVCDILNISPSTARILLQKMHDKGLLVRTHGGAVKADYPNALNSAESSISAIMADIPNLEKKQQIAIAAAATVKDGDFIAISSGTTALLMALLLKDRKELSVITDSIPVANTLIFQPEIRVFVCGGQVRHRNGACFGPTAEEFLKTLKVDKAYSSCDSVDVDFGITSLDIDPRTEKYLCLCGRTRYVLADSTKFSVKPFMEKTVDLSDIDYIVTDSGLDEEHIHKLGEKGIKVIIG